MKRLNATIYGRVQGVSFRYHTQRVAQQLDIKGWVANQRDGSVHTVAEGKDDNLQAFLEFLHQGPTAARIDRVNYTWHGATGEFHRFQVKWL